VSTIGLWLEPVIGKSPARLATSKRVFNHSHEGKSSTTIYDWRHYLAIVQRKPGALRNGAPFAELPAAFGALHQRLLKTQGGDREMVEILALVLQHDKQAVLTAVGLALENGAPTNAYFEPAPSLGRRQTDRPASREAAQRPDAEHGTANQCRALRRPA